MSETIQTPPSTAHEYLATMGLDKTWVRLDWVNRFVDPYWCCKEHPQVSSVFTLLDGRPVVNYLGQMFAGAGFHFGDVVTLRADAQGYVYAEPIDKTLAREAAEAEFEKLRLRHAADAAQKMLHQQQQLREQALAQHASIQLPVRWDVRIKIVLAGLTANSNGSGRKANTVQHIHLLEDLDAGRLQRARGDFLCTSAKGNNGSYTAPLVPPSSDMPEATRAPSAVTCTACLKAARRWTQQAAN